MALTVLRPDERVGPGITTTVRHEGVTTVVVLRGEADFANTTVLSDTLSRLIATPGGDVVIDLRETEFIDTATIRTFAVPSELFRDRSRKLTFRSPSRLAARVLGLFGLWQSIERSGRAPS